MWVRGHPQAKSMRQLGDWRKALSLGILRLTAISCPTWNKQPVSLRRSTQPRTLERVSSRVAKGLQQWAAAKRLAGCWSASEQTLGGAGVKVTASRSMRLALAHLLSLPLAGHSWTLGQTPADSVSLTTSSLVPSLCPAPPIHLSLLLQPLPVLLPILLHLSSPPWWTHNPVQGPAHPVLAPITACPATHPHGRCACGAVPLQDQHALMSCHLDVNDTPKFWW